MKNFYKKIKQYNLGKKRKLLIVFNDMIADMIINKQFNPVVTELFIRKKTLNISIVLLTQSNLKCQPILD